MKQAPIIIIITLVVCSNALAEVTISEVYYNPSGSEYELEFVELYNNGTEAVELSGWWLNTSSSERDATLPLGASVSPNSHYLIADTGFSAASPDEWPEADYEEDMSLSNSGGYVRLENALGTQDIVEWDGSCAEGESYAGECLPPSPSSALPPLSAMLEVKLSVEQELPQITAVLIEDEDTEKQGIQILPIPGALKHKQVSVQGSGFSEGKLEFEGQEYQLNSSSAIILIPYSLCPGNHTLTVSVCSQAHCTATAQILEIQEVLAFELDTEKLELNLHKGNLFQLLGDQDFSTKDKPTIMNTGNTPLGFEVSSNGLSLNGSHIPPNAIAVQLAGEGFFELSSSFIPSSRLPVLGSWALSLQFDLPQQVEPGEYNGHIMLRGFG